jgi:hypothetical protein
MRLKSLPHTGEAARLRCTILAGTGVPFPLRQSPVSSQPRIRQIDEYVLTITVGTNYIQSNLSWQIPLILQAYSCVFVMVLVFFIPESPRFHMANGKTDLALAFLVKYHGNGDENSPLVLLEYNEWQEQISQSGADKRWWDCMSLRHCHSF